MKYGKLSLDSAAGRWRVDDVAPHVAIAMKRLFPKLQKESDRLALADSDEVRADLDWFMQRYPFETKDAAEIKSGVERVANRKAGNEAILLPTWTPAEPKRFKEGKKPYLYQAQAAKITIENRALLLADEIGLGKTISAAAVMTDDVPMPCGVVVEPHLASQWKDRLEEFTDLRVHVIRGVSPYDLPPADVYIFKFSNIYGWVDVLGKGLLRVVAWDEIQNLRRGKESARGRAAAVIAREADILMGLTATPVYNYGDEAHTIYDYVKPGLLGSREEFLREWCTAGARGRQVKDPDALGAFLADTGYFLRRTEDDDIVDVSLPPPNILAYEVEYDQAVAKSEEELTRQLAMTVMNGSFAAAGRAARELDARLRQVTGIAKARAVASYVKMLLQYHRRVIVSGWHREVYEIWMRDLSLYDPVLYTGTESEAGKRKSKEAFTLGSSRVMLISNRSGAGLDGLQGYCDQAVIGELDWSPQVHRQFIGRVRRPGQPNEVTAHYLHANGGSDPVLMEILGIKSDQNRGIVAPGIAPKPRVSNDSRIKALAEHVLTRSAGSVPAMSQPLLV